MSVAAFSGGPLDGEMRFLNVGGYQPPSAPPFLRIPVFNNDVAISADEPDPSTNPSTMVEIDTFLYVRHSYDCHTGLTIYVPDGERPYKHVPVEMYGHQMCRSCDVRWYGTPNCWNCGKAEQMNTRLEGPPRPPIIHRPGCSWETTPYCDCGADPERPIIPPEDPPLSPGTCV